MGAELVEGAVVVDHVGGDSGALFIAGLCGDDVERILARHGAVGCQPLQTSLQRRLDDDHSIESGDEAILDEQRDVVHLNVLGTQFGDKSLHAQPNQRVQDRVEICAGLIIAKDDAPQGGPVQTTIGKQDGFPEPLDHSGQTRSSHLHDFTRDMVCIDQHGTQTDQNLGDSRFASADPSGQPDPRHGSGVQRGEHLVGDIKVGKDVLHVIEVFDCLEQVEHLARALFVQLDADAGKERRFG